MFEAVIDAASPAKTFQRIPGMLIHTIEVTGNIVKLTLAAAHCL